MASGSHRGGEEFYLIFLYPNSNLVKSTSRERHLNMAPGERNSAVSCIIIGGLK